MFKRGDIVIVFDLLDPRGNTPKNRPCVLLSPPERIEAGGPLDVVAMTTLLPDPLPFDHVLLPWHQQGHPRTGLNKRNAAVCTWLVQIEASRIDHKIGHTPGKQLLQIAAILQSLRGDEAE
jgi:mRNA-degrading endonuclease toxin of MazEF toxin-antitoxin module